MSSASSSAAHQGVQGGMKAASSNSDLLNDLFAPPAGQTGAVQEDLFFSGPTSGATPDSKRTVETLIHNCYSIIKNFSVVLNAISFSLTVSVLQPWATCLIRLGWGLALVLAPVWVHLGRPLDRTCLETCWVLMVQAPAGFPQLRPAPLLLPTQASSTSVSTSATVASWHHSA